MRFKEMYGVVSWIDYIKYSRVDSIISDIKFYLWFNYKRPHYTSYPFYNHYNELQIKDKFKNWLP